MEGKVKKVEHVCLCGNEVCCMGMGNCSGGCRRHLSEEMNKADKGS